MTSTPLLTLRRLSAGQANGVCLVMLLEGLSSSSINVQTAAVRSDLDAGPVGLQMVASAFLIAYAVLLLPCGRLVDRGHPRRLFLVGLALFGLGSALAVVSPSVEMLVVARLLQGGGAALSTPAALALLTLGLPAGPDRNRLVARFGAMGAIGFSAGLVLPGLLVAHVGWRSSFAVLLPVVVAVGLLTWRAPSAPASPLRPRWADVAGLLRQPSVRAGGIALAGGFAGVLSSIYVLTLALQDWYGIDPFMVGLLVLPQPLTFALASRWGAALVDRHGCRAPLLVGLLLIGTAVGALSLSGQARPGPVLVLVTMAAIGAGLALTYPAATILAVDGSQAWLRGSAAAILTTCQNLGGSAGIAIVTALALVPVAGAPGSLLGPLLVPASILVLTAAAVAATLAMPLRAGHR